ncbi:sensor histidine kinase [Brevundimonas variabilis]|uniref:Histidine kinase n=1 Tax=Brevundimonas variabilis TaxID=74312 RepID=A0A7W9CJE5_9CAUL|nr:histidine kinase [Brevundimonas variabilis]MBB5746282.1 hypothetical protein [Brevundimonas variabilis]
MGWSDQTGMLFRRLCLATVGIALAWSVHLVLARFTGRQLTARATIAFVLCVPATAAFAVLNTLVFYDWFPVPSVADDLARWDYPSVIKTAIADGLVTWYFFFAAWAAFYLALGHVSEVRVAERATARAKLNAQEARLAMLRLQVDPHFLFNAMNALSSLVARQQIKPAGAMIRDLSDFFRAGLVIDPAADITLGEEIELQRLYLAVERARFGDRLDVTFDVPDQFLNVRVPALLIQPLIENAIKHGLGATSAPVRITVKTECRDNRLLISVANDTDGGYPLPSAERPSTGVGLSNVRARVETRFGSGATLDARARKGGWMSEIIIPMAGLSVRG